MKQNWVVPIMLVVLLPLPVSTMMMRPTSLNVAVVIAHFIALGVSVGIRLVWR